MARAPIKETTRPDNDPAASGEMMSELPQPITDIHGDDVNQESDSQNKHNSEADRKQYLFVEESDCDGEDDIDSSRGSELSKGWVRIMEPFTFVTSTQVDFPVHVKMYVQLFLNARYQEISWRY